MIGEKIFAAVQNRRMPVTLCSQEESKHLKWHRHKDIERMTVKYGIRLVTSIYCILLCMVVTWVTQRGRGRNPEWSPSRPGVVSF